MSSSLTTIIILVSVIHVAAFVVMVWIRVRRCEAEAAGTGPTTWPTTATLRGPLTEPTELS